MSYWKDKSVVLTGATSGLGRCMALRLIGLGANVAFCGRSEEKMNQLLQEIKAEAIEHIYHEVFEIAEQEKVVAFVRKAAEKFEGVDVLINCAGANPARAMVEDIKIEDLQMMLMVNTMAPLIFMQECYKHMKAKNQGLIVNILSTCCLFSNEGIGAYTASKAALDGLTKVFRKEARKNNVRICSVYPGGINTAFRTQSREDYLNPESTAEALLKALDIDSGIALDELVLRPFIETNYC